MTRGAGASARGSEELGPSRPTHGSGRWSAQWRRSTGKERSSSHAMWGFRKCQQVGSSQAHGACWPRKAVADDSRSRGQRPGLERATHCTPSGGGTRAQALGPLRPFVARVLARRGQCVVLRVERLVPCGGGSCTCHGLPNMRQMDTVRDQPGGPSFPSACARVR